jgi:hypothetical protein
MPDTKQQKAERRVIQAALTWWRSKRPRDWDRRLHLANAMINTTSEREQVLAIAVAEYCKAVSAPSAKEGE